MDLALYQTLTGKTVPVAEQARVIAQIARVQTRLQTLLGYALTPSNIYNELGKNDLINPCLDFPQSYQGMQLLPPDKVKGVVKIFPYNPVDKYFATDPFITVHSCKIITMAPSNLADDDTTVLGNSYISIHKFKHPNPTYSIDNNSGIGNYIGRCPEWFLPYGCVCNSCVFVAVDAEWLTDYPDDIKYLWADMVDYYVEEQYKIRSESVDGHSVSYNAIDPTQLPTNILTLKSYAGPYGTLFDKVPTI